MSLLTALLVAAGAAVGAPLRLLVGLRLPGPRGTLAVNAAGSLLLGLVTGLPDGAYALLGTGFCGAFTTLSTFAVEAVDGAGARYVATTLAVCLPLAALGLALGP